MRNTTEELFAAALALPWNERNSCLIRACRADGLSEALLETNRFSEAESHRVEASLQLRQNCSSLCHVARAESALGEALYRQGARLTASATSSSRIYYSPTLRVWTGSHETVRVSV